jgi:hypothetical protein
MKTIVSIALFITLFSCQQSNGSRAQAKIDSLQKQLNEAYRPGLGEFMNSIQLHHAKLWFAGTNENWKLADFEMHEISEVLDDIKKYNTDRDEVKKIDMIDPPLDSMNRAIQKKNVLEFKSSFVALTNVCNSCHQATDHEFNVVIVPAAPPVTNQDFKIH